MGGRGWGVCWGGEDEGDCSEGVGTFVLLEE